jgi:hypothetical protein
MKKMSKILFIGFCTILFFGCDGKPPEMVEKKIAQRSESQFKPAENDNGLMNPSWGLDSVWQNGMIEEATYRIQFELNGETDTLIEVRRTQKEAFNKQFYTSTLDTTRTDIFGVMSQHVLAKGNHVQYAFDVAVLQKDLLNTAKFSSSFQNENGVVSKTFRRLIGRAVLYVHAWQGEMGDGEYELGKVYLLEDQLPLTLRGLNFKVGQEFIWQLIERQTTPFAPKPKILDAEFSILALDTVATNFEKLPCYKISMTVSKTEQLYWFEAKFPHLLIKSEQEESKVELISRRWIPRELAVLKKLK